MCVCVGVVSWAEIKMRLVMAAMMTVATDAEACWLAMSKSEDVVELERVTRDEVEKGGWGHVRRGRRGININSQCLH